MTERVVSEMERSGLASQAELEWEQGFGGRGQGVRDKRAGSWTHHAMDAEVTGLMAGLGSRGRWEPGAKCLLQEGWNQDLGNGKQCRGASPKGITPIAPPPNHHHREGVL